MSRKLLDTICGLFGRDVLPEVRGSQRQSLKLPGFRALCAGKGQDGGHGIRNDSVLDAGLYS